MTSYNPWRQMEEFEKAHPSVAFSIRLPEGRRLEIE